MAVNIEHEDLELDQIEGLRVRREHPARGPEGTVTSDAPTEPLRIGILGASRIADLSIVKPAAVTGHRLVAVAARDPERAKVFAASHGVERVHATYDDLLADPEVEAVYNPLANGLHGPWNLRALAAGKHVLAEKPSAANAAEARTVRAAVARAGVVYMEAFHYPYHPLFQRVTRAASRAAASARCGASRRSWDAGAPGHRPAVVPRPRRRVDDGPRVLRDSVRRAGGGSPAERLE